MAYANRRSGGPFFGQIAALQDFVLDLLPREPASSSMNRPSHIRAVKIATVA
jgi:hypothetical protein